jgi:hypothetical protein
LGILIKGNKMEKFKDFITEAKMLTLKDFSEALKEDDYGFRMGKCADAAKEYMQSIYGTKELYYMLPGNVDEPGEGKGYFKYNDKKVNVDFDNKKALEKTIKDINNFVKTNKK